MVHSTHHHTSELVWYTAPITSAQSRFGTQHPSPQLRVGSVHRTHHFSSDQVWSSPPITSIETRSGTHKPSPYSSNQVWYTPSSTTAETSTGTHKPSSQLRVGLVHIAKSQSRSDMIHSTHHHRSEQVWYAGNITRSGIQHT